MTEFRELLQLFRSTDLPGALRVVGGRVSGTKEERISELLEMVERYPLMLPDGVVSVLQALSVESLARVCGKLGADSGNRAAMVATLMNHTSVSGSVETGEESKSARFLGSVVGLGALLLMTALVILVLIRQLPEFMRWVTYRISRSPKLVLIPWYSRTPKGFDSEELEALKQPQPGYLQGLQFNEQERAEIERVNSSEVLRQLAEQRFAAGEHKQAVITCLRAAGLVDVPLVYATLAEILAAFGDVAGAHWALRRYDKRSGQRLAEVQEDPLAARADLVVQYQDLLRPEQRKPLTTKQVGRLNLVATMEGRLPRPDELESMLIEN